MNKFFNVAGPCIQTEHYMLNTLNRLQEMVHLIEQKIYFVMHAARQSGKTTLLLELTQKLNKEGKYYALYCSLEALQRIPDHKEGIPAIIKTIKNALNKTSLPNIDKFSKHADFSDYSNVLNTELSSYCALLDKPLVVFFDEADCLSDDTLITFLRQLRNGYNTRSLTPFVHSLALVGMRNIRDYKAKIRKDVETLGSASPFNIVTKSLTLKNFTEQEIESLYLQHTTETGQVFEKEAIQEVYKQTSGQPWLVNAIAREAVVEILNNDYSKRVTAGLVKQSVENIILRRDTHIDSLLERLKEERVRKIIEPIIIGEGQIDKLSDDYLYTKDLGLIHDTNNKLEPSNRIYSEVIIRTLTYNTQESLKVGENDYIISKYTKNYRIDMDYLLKDFQVFWRENGAMWKERYDYQEAAPHLILMAFLQKVVNGGASIRRELAAERGRLDLCIEYDQIRYPIEIKLRYSTKTYEDGMKQLSRYMDSLGCEDGWLVVFDKRKSISWSKKLFIRKKEVEHRKITIIGV